MSEEITRKISLPYYDSGEENFALSWIKFKTCGLVNGFRQALTGAKEASSHNDADEVLDLSTASGKKAQKALNRNNLAIACATMEFATKDLTTKVCKARTVECSG